VNPLDLTGPEFLAFYAVLLLVMVAIAAFLRWSLRLPSDEPSPHALDLSPYEAAYLAGGEQLAVNAAMARLVQEECLAVDSANRKLTLRSGGRPEPSSELERAVFSAVRGAKGETIANVRSRAAAALAPFRQRLAELGLLVPEDQSWKPRFIPLFAVLSVVVLGVLKIFVGLSRNKPVTFLVIFCVVSVVVSFAGFGRAVQRSRRGDRALDRLRKSNGALEYSGRRRADDLAGDDLVLAIGLFGMGVLAGGRLAELQTALKPPPSSNSCGGGCGSSSCGGGCGGGCGGCGG
jgi:uncharacterized protein (TIGR04222 family)